MWMSGEYPEWWFSGQWLALYLFWKTLEASKPTHFTSVLQLFSIGQVFQVCFNQIVILLFRVDTSWKVILIFAKQKNDSEVQSSVSWDGTSETKQFLGKPGTVRGQTWEQQDISSCSMSFSWHFMESILVVVLKSSRFWSYWFSYLV